LDSRNDGAKPIDILLVNEELIDDRIKIMIVAGITKSRSERSVHIVTLLDKRDGMVERASK
jgi:hypoxanthine-guanine phosphoribosyltransferase